MRILHLREPEIGGVQTVVEQYVENTRDLEHVIAHTTLRRTRAVSAHLEPGRSFEWQSADWRSPPQMALRWLVNEVRPDVVHAHSSFAGLFARTTPGLGAPIVYTPHCFAFERLDVSPTKQRAFRAVEARLLRRTSVLAGASRREVELGKELAGGHSLPIVEVPHAATRSRGPIRSRGSEQLVVGCIGRLAPQKRPDIFHEIVLADQREGASHRFVWIGDGDSVIRAQLEADGVEVTGWLTQPEVFDRLDTLDAVIHVADWEVGDPLVCIEAAAQGLPVGYRSVPSSGSNLVGRSFNDVDGCREWLGLIEDQAVYRAESKAALLATDHFDAAAQGVRLRRAYDIATDGSEPHRVG